MQCARNSHLDEHRAVRVREAHSTRCAVQELAQRRPGFRNRISVPSASRRQRDATKRSDRASRAIMPAQIACEAARIAVQESTIVGGIANDLARTTAPPSQAQQRTGGWPDLRLGSDRRGARCRRLAVGYVASVRTGLPVQQAEAGRAGDELVIYAANGEELGIIPPTPCNTIAARRSAIMQEAIIAIETSASTRPARSTCRRSSAPRSRLVTGKPCRALDDRDAARRPPLPRHQESFERK